MQLTKNLAARLIVFCILWNLNPSLAQVGINTTTPNGILDVNSTTEGIVLPRVSLTATNVASPILNPQGGGLAVGTVVYNTNTTATGTNDVYKGIYVWNGTEWYNKFPKKQSEIFEQNSMLRTRSNAGWQVIPNLNARTFIAEYTGTYKIELSMNYGGGYVNDVGPNIDILTQEGNFRLNFNGTNYTTRAKTYCTILGTRYYAIWEQFSRRIYVNLIAGTSYTFSVHFDQDDSPNFANTGNSGNGQGYIGIPDHAPCAVEFIYIDN